MAAPASGAAPAEQTYPEKCLHVLLEEQVARTPDRIAVVDGETQLTYRQFNDLADVLALRFRALGINNGDAVGIFMPKTVEYSIAYAAALKAGGAYTILDAAYPDPMIKMVLGDAKPKVCVTSAALADRLPDDQPAIVMSKGWESREDVVVGPEEAAALPPVQCSLDSRAYIVYSSGTTGRPKGIQCPHRGSVHAYTWRLNNVPYEEDEREACNIFFTWEMFRPLLGGATLYIIPDTTIYDPTLLAKFLRENRITRMLFTPSLLEALLNEPGVDVTKDLSSFRNLLLCGEVVTTDLRARTVNLLPGRGLWNLYSISECHDVSCTDLLTRPNEGRKYCTVGEFLPEVSVVLLDEQMNPVPVGLDGEIFVGGPTLAIGYLNRPEITAERFIASPPSVPDRHGPRLYRTGDVGRLLPSGELEIVGRCDSMQKVRGYSVELRAVQAAVQARPGVTACEVLVLGDEGTDKQLVAYVCLEDGMTPTGVRSAVKAVLPHYMIPSYFVEVQHMPMTPIGKLDKKALPNLEEIMEQAKERIKQDRDQAPTADEARMIALWKAVLGLNFVDLTESFFDLGGHSLLAAKLIGEIRREFKAPELTVVQLFAHPTVRALTAAVCGTDGEVPPPTDAQIDLPAEVAAHDYSRAEFSLLVRAFWRRERLYNKSNNGFANSVLLTGAGGFFGCFMLQSLLKTTAANVFCLIRPAPNLTALQKLRGRMQHYGLWEPGFAGRIELLNGNIELSKLGLTEDEYTFLGTHIDCVIHGAAKVNLVYPYTGLRQANVVGTQNVLKFCLRGKIKPLYYVSTNGVFPLGSTNCMEDGSIDDVHARLQDGYAQSKWVAEQLVRRAQKCGLPAVVFRPGNLSGPISHPAWNPNDFNHLLLTGCLRLGAVPVLAGWRLEMTPVNDAASFLVSTLGQVGLLGQTFHIVNPKAVPLSDFFADFPEEGPGSLRRLPYAEWRALLLASQDPSVAELQSAMEVLPDAAQVTKLSSFDTTNYAAVAAANGLELPQLGKRAIREYHRHFRERGITVQRQADPSRPLLGQVALVTGASSGIGRAIATALAKAGASVGLAARRLDRLEELSASLRATYGSRVCAVATDVTKRSEVKAFVAEACEKLGGPVDILVNNAGVMHYTKMGNLMEDQWEQAVDVNCKGVLNGIGAVLGPMLARGQGHIVNTSSDAGRKVFAGLAVYSGTKFFVEAVSQGLRLECAGTGVKVTTVQPGDCQTELAKCTTDEEARSEYAQPSKDRNVWLDPEDVASAVLYAVSAPGHVGINEILIEPRDAPA